MLYEFESLNNWFIRFICSGFDYAIHALCFWITKKNWFIRFICSGFDYISSFMLLNH